MSAIMFAVHDIDEMLERLPWDSPKNSAERNEKVAAGEVTWRWQGQFRSTPALVRHLFEPTPTQDLWHALFRPRCSGFCLLRR